MRRSTLLLSLASITLTASVSSRILARPSTNGGTPPTIASETDLDPGVLIPTVTGSGDLAANGAGTTYLYAWPSESPDPPRVYFQRIGGDGKPIDRLPRVLAEVPPTATSEGVAVAPATNGWMVVWNEAIYQRGNTMRSALVADDGTVSAPLAVTATDADDIAPHLAGDAAGNYEVVWNGANDLLAAHLDAKGALVGAPITVRASQPVNFSHTSQVAWSSGTYLCVWTEGTSLLGARIDDSGALTDATPLTLATTAVDGAQTSAVGGGANGFLAVWSSGSGLFAARLAPNGTLVDANAIRLSMQGVGGTVPEVSYAAGRYAVTWYDWSPEATHVREADGAVSTPGGKGFDRPEPYVSPTQVASTSTSSYMAWMGLSNPEVPLGTILESDDTADTPFTYLSPSVARESHATVGASPSDYLAAWQVDESDQAGIWFARVDGAGTPESAARLDVAAAGSVGPMVVWTGTQWLVAWTDTSSSFHPARGVRVSAQGKVLDATPIDLAPARDWEVRYAAAGGGGYALVAWIANLDVGYALVSSDGKTAGGATIAPHPMNGDWGGVAAASDGAGRFAVAYSASDGLYAAFVDAATAPNAPVVVPVAKTTGLGAVAATYVSGALVIAASDQAGALSAYRVDPAQPSQVSGYAWSPRASYAPALAFDGQNVIAAWTDSTSNTASMHALAFDRGDLSSGAPLTPFAESTLGPPALASRGAGHSVVAATRWLPMRTGAGIAAIESTLAAPDAGAPDAGGGDAPDGSTPPEDAGPRADAGKPQPARDAGPIANGDAGGGNAAAPGGDAGGCGCTAAGRDAPPFGAGIAALALALAAAARRKDSVRRDRG